MMTVCLGIRAHLFYRHIVLRSDCSKFATSELKAEIYRVIKRLINVINKRHMPKLYSRLAGETMSRKHMRDISPNDSKPPQKT